MGGGGKQQGVQRSQGWWKAEQLPGKKCTRLLCSSVLQQLNEVGLILEGEDFTASVRKSFKVRVGMVTFHDARDFIY